MAEEYWITVDGVRTHYLSAGQAGEPVVLLHGGGLDSASVSWKESIGPLAQAQRVFALDWPGFGQSDMPVSEPSVKSYAEFLAHFMDALGISRASLAGISLGGAIALSFTLRWPQRVDRLVLVDSYGLQTEVPFAALSSLVLRIPFINELSWKALSGSRRMTRWSMRQFLSNPQAITPELVDELYALLKQPGAGATWRRLQMSEVTPSGLRTIHVSRLGDIGAPTLIVHGEKDRLVPVECARRAHQLIAGSRLLILPGCGHWPPREKPREFNQAVTAFLAQQ